MPDEILHSIFYFIFDRLEVRFGIRIAAIMTIMIFFGIILLMILVMWLLFGG